MVVEVLKKFKILLYQLTPNAIMLLGVFICIGGLYCQMSFTIAFYAKTLFHVLPKGTMKLTFIHTEKKIGGKVEKLYLRRVNR